MSSAKIIPIDLAVLLLMLSGFVFTAGCDRGPTGPPKYPTTGTLTNNGKPVPDAQVVFHSTELRMSRAAVTGPDGQFIVRAGTGNGLPAGTYQVVVRASPIGETEEEMVEYRRSDIPEIFWMKSTTPLKKTIEKGENRVDIDLKDSK